MRDTPSEYGVARENEEPDNPVSFADRISTILSNQAPVLVTLEEDKQRRYNLAHLYSEFRLSPEDIVAACGQCRV